jgi:hypothetical protein
MKNFGNAEDYIRPWRQRREVEDALVPSLALTKNFGNAPPLYSDRAWSRDVDAKPRAPPPPPAPSTQAIKEGAGLSTRSPPWRWRLGWGNMAERGVEAEPTSCVRGRETPDCGGNATLVRGDLPRGRGN